jgi:hypothetical protein
MSTRAAATSREWIAREVAFGHAHTADVDAGQVLRPGGAEHELRGASADVDDEGRRIDQSSRQSADRAHE